MEFNENRVSGTDGLASNLTATLAYYVYMILGLDFDSFALTRRRSIFSESAEYRQQCAGRTGYCRAGGLLMDSGTGTG